MIFKKLLASDKNVLQCFISLKASKLDKYSNYIFSPKLKEKFNKNLI